MRIKHLFKVSVMVLTLVAMFSVFTACGNNSKGNGDESSVAPEISTVEQSVVGEQLKAEAEKVPEPDTKAAVTSDSLLGGWNDINDATRFVEIAKNGEEYQYKDNDGTYTGTFADGVLTIKVSDAENDTAKVFLETETGNLILDYQGDIYEFTKRLAN